MNAMNTNFNNSQSAGPLGFIMGKSVLSQLVMTLVLAIVLYIVFMSFEILYKNFRSIKGTRVEVLPYTANSTDKPRNFDQDPGTKNSLLLPLSDNERTGAEFSYSFYLWINPNSFRTDDGLLHIFHKGNPVPYPLMGPGVFLKSNTNTLRVYMNSTSNWNNFVDIENIPVSKWVHVVVMARSNAIEVYINGNLAKKLNMDGAVLYQNFGNLYLFSPRNTFLGKVGDTENTRTQIFGTYTGNLSNLIYYSYALSYTEIQTMMAMGPSSKMETSREDNPPYLQDNWWVQ